MKPIYFDLCPRCDERGYERLATHCYCVACNYSPDLAEAEHDAVPRWAIDALDGVTNENDQTKQTMDAA